MNKIINHFNKYKKSYYILFFIIFAFNFPVWNIIMNISIKNIILDSQLTPNNMEKDIEIIISFLTDLLTILIAIISLLFAYFTFMQISNTNKLKECLKDLEVLIVDLLKLNNNVLSFDQLKAQNYALYENVEFKGFATLILSKFLNYENTYNNFLKILDKMKYLKCSIIFCFILFIIDFVILLDLLPFSTGFSRALFFIFIAISLFVILYLNNLNNSDFKYYPKPFQLLTPSFTLSNDISKYLNIIPDLPLKLFAVSTIVSIKPFHPDNFLYPKNTTKPNISQITHYITLKTFLKFNIEDSSYVNIALTNYIAQHSPKLVVKFFIIPQLSTNAFWKYSILAFPNWIFNKNENIFLNVENTISTMPTALMFRSSEESRIETLKRRNKFYSITLSFNFKNPAECIFNYNHNISSEEYWSFKPISAAFASLTSDKSSQQNLFYKEASDINIFKEK